MRVAQTLSRVFVRVEEVSMTYASRTGPVEALREVTFTAEEGEFLALLGPSGCGKSTLLLLVAGLLRPSRGRIVWRDGRVVSGPQRDLGIVFQDHLLLEWRTVLGNILIQAEMRGLDRRHAEARARWFIDRVGLAGFEHKHPFELSGGMRQRVAICRALIHNPPLLLMDEPFGALDALTREQMRLDLERLWLESRNTVLFVTHDISEAILLSDRVIVMTPRPGRIAGTLRIDLPRPRSVAVLGAPAFLQYRKQILDLLTEMGIFHR